MHGLSLKIPVIRFKCVFELNYCQTGGKFKTFCGQVLWGFNISPNLKFLISPIMSGLSLKYILKGSNVDLNEQFV